MLTAILTIASKDGPNMQEIHAICWGYMKELLLDVLLGHPSTQHIGSVEGLLLLSDWLPHIQFEKSTYTKSSETTVNVTEDSMAWSLVGQAVRQAYLLRLDQTCFRDNFGEQSKTLVDRKRLIWSCA